MDLSKLTIFKMAGKRMSWLSQRQNVLAHNIANSDTPKYTPVDLKSQNFSRFVRPTIKPASMRMTSANHIEPLRHPPKHRDGPDKDTYEVAPAGNAVILEEQLMKVAETQSDFRLATNLYNKHLSMIKTALGRNGQ